MAYIIKDSPYHYVRGIDRLGFYELTESRDDAKRFETKPDAKTVQDQFGLGGSIIPA